MKKSLEETLKEVELCKEIYRLYALEHLTMSEISVKFGYALSSIHYKIRTFEAENPELAEKMRKKGKDIIPEDYKQLLQEIAELKKQVKSERLRADFYEEMVAFGKEVYGIDLKKLAPSSKQASHTRCQTLSSHLDVSLTWCNQASLLQTW